MLLQDLPAEVLTQILASVGNLSDLWALATISHRIYSIFRRESAALIYQALTNDLGPVVADVIGLSHLQCIDASLSTFATEAEHAVATYSGLLSETQNHLFPRRLSSDYVLRLARSQRAMAYMAAVYIACTFQLMKSKAQPPCQNHTSASTADSALTPLSNSERQRVVRAHYRLQIVLHVWDRRRANPSKSGTTLALSFSHSGNRRSCNRYSVLLLFYRRLRVQLRYLPFGDRKINRDVTSRQRFYCFDRFRTFKLLQAVDSASWQAYAR